MTDEIKQIQYKPPSPNEFKTFEDKYGSYGALVKDIQILHYFISYGDVRYLRQKTILEQFKAWHPRTVRLHLYGLLDKKVLIEDPGFRGSYKLNTERLRDIYKDLGQLLEKLLGKDMFDLIKSDFKSDWEFERRLH